MTVGDVEEKGTITFTCVCDHCKMLSVEDVGYCQLLRNTEQE